MNMKDTALALLAFQRSGVTEEVITGDIYLGALYLSFGGKLKSVYGYFGPHRKIFTIEVDQAVIAYAQNGNVWVPYETFKNNRQYLKKVTKNGLSMQLKSFKKEMQ